MMDWTISKFLTGMYILKVFARMSSSIGISESVLFLHCAILVYFR